MHYFQLHFHIKQLFIGTAFYYHQLTCFIGFDQSLLYGCLFEHVNRKVDRVNILDTPTWSSIMNVILLLFISQGKIRLNNLDPFLYNPLHYDILIYMEPKGQWRIYLDWIINDKNKTINKLK